MSPSSMLGTSVPPSNRQDLTRYLSWIWQMYFPDCLRMNEVVIDYCYPWKSRLGLIRLSLDTTLSYIGVNSLLQVTAVPEEVLVITIAHEMVHYLHGFGSPLPRRYKHPHANRIVERELEQRKLGEMLRACNEWIDNHWYSFYDTQWVAGWAGVQGPCRTTQRACR